jgi:hypothetical protein
MKLRSATAVTAILAIAGCSPTPDTQTTEILARLDQQTERLAKLEKQVGELRDRKPPAPIAPPPADAAADPAQLQAYIAAVVQQTLDQRLGSEAEIDKIFQETVTEQMTAYEARKVAEREAEREKQRQEWEQRRQEWDKRQWDSLKTELALNDVQTEQFKALNDGVRDSIRATMETMREQGGEMDPAKIKDLATKMRADYETRLKGVLTAEQITAYRERPMSMLRMMDMFVESGRMFDGRRGGPDRGGGPGGGPDRGGGPGR